MTTIGTLQNGYLSPVLPKSSAETVRQPEKSFSDMLGESIGKVELKQAEAEQAIEKLAAGDSNNLHQTMIALEKAEISLELMLQVRNKIVAAYEEIKRMQI
jgi:flagellar hook-basal body complex protein FliE